MKQQVKTEFRSFYPGHRKRFHPSMTGPLLCIIFLLLECSNARNNTTIANFRRLTDPTLVKTDKRTLFAQANCPPIEIENAAPIRVENLPARSNTWTFPIYCKPGYSLIGPCRLVCKELSGNRMAFSPPYGLEMPRCVKDYASSQLRCHYLSSVCPVVWDNVPEPFQPPIAISRIFCGQITNFARPNNMQVFGFGASMFASAVGGNLCHYKGGIKDIPCYIVKGQRMVPVANGNEIPAITYLGNLHGYEALGGSEDPYIGKLSRRTPYYLFPPDLSPYSLASSLREYLATCVKRHGQSLLRCHKIMFLTSSKSGYDILIGGYPVFNGITDAFPLPPSRSCLKQRCCCNLNESS